MHWRDPLDGHDVWEPPGGGLDPGEDHLRAARRELAEETGLDLRFRTPLRLALPAWCSSCFLSS
ncbi:hypothetical protein Asp14428_07000 [Actinoplanes sp. NBRC 14428]|nr:hypothetical protein Asp14428_07000 [Actinoplanes sp. NBRC 14428]